MQRLRLWLMGNREWSLALILLTLCVKAAIPAGYMLSKSPDRVVTISICADASGSLQQMQMVLPGKGQGVAHSGSAKIDGECAFSSLAQSALGGADAVLLALAIAFILMLGLQATKPLCVARFAFLRPPLRGPPVTI